MTFAVLRPKPPARIVIGKMVKNGGDGAWSTTAYFGNEADDCSLRHEPFVHGAQDCAWNNLQPGSVMRECPRDFTTLVENGRSYRYDFHSIFPNYFKDQAQRKRSAAQPETDLFEGKSCLGRKCDVFW